MEKYVKEKLDQRKKEFNKKISQKIIAIEDEELKKWLTKDINKCFEFDIDKFKEASLVINSKMDFFKKEVTLKNLPKIARKFSTIFGVKFETIKMILNKSDDKSLERFKKIINDQYELEILKEYMMLFDLERQKFLDELYAKMDYIAKMTEGIKSFSNIFGRFWDLSIHNLYTMDISFIKKMESLMREKIFVSKIAELLGRLASSYKEYEEHLIKEMKYIPNNRKTMYAPENTVGITTGNNLFDILKHQLGYRNDDRLRLLFNKMFTEKQLIMLDKRAKVVDEVEVKRKERRLRENGKGPFIIVVDTSGSMHGEPELIAKTFALALIKIANKENRKCFIINFSVGIVEFDASDLGSSWTSLYNFLASSFSGGTDINPAIEATLKKVKENDYKNADVLLISDLIINSLGVNLEKGIIEAKKNKVRFHSLTIGNSYHKLNTSFLDNNWVYDGTPQSVNKIVKDLSEMNRELESKNNIE